MQISIINIGRDVCDLLPKNQKLIHDMNTLIVSVLVKNKNKHFYKIVYYFFSPFEFTNLKTTSIKKT